MTHHLTDDSAAVETGADKLKADDLKAKILEIVAERDKDPIRQKIALLDKQLMPLFEALAQLNQVSDTKQQIPLMQGLWYCYWSTIPFQDILPGRIHEQSYQIFSDNGLYANLARYRPGHKQPFFNFISKFLLSYDLMILQTYAIPQTASSNQPSEPAQVLHQWDIENVGIKQRLKVGPAPLDAARANEWFRQAIAQYEQHPDKQDAIAMPTKGVNNRTRKRYEKVYKARPQLEHLYIDADFRLVKSIREQSQRPSYTIAIRQLP